MLGEGVAFSDDWMTNQDHDGGGIPRNKGLRKVLRYRR